MRAEDPEAAAAAVARQAGLPVTATRRVWSAANVLVRIDPGPAAVRLAGMSARFRDPHENLAREVALAGALAAAGAPVAGPLPDVDPGPYATAAHVGTLWAWVEEAEPPDASPADAAVALAACHAALAGLDPPGAPWAVVREADRILALLPAGARDAIAPLGEAIAARTAAVAAPLRPVHGDPHAGNVLWTAAGPVWSDWEDAHLAPLEWDLACLVTHGRMRGGDFGWGEEALAGYPGPFDPALLDDCVRARAWQAVAYTALMVQEGLREPEDLAMRIAWLRDRL